MSAEYEVIVSSADTGFSIYLTFHLTLKVKVSKLLSQKSSSLLKNEIYYFRMGVNSKKKL